MNPTPQPGTHPDADSLSAFAEQSLPAAERDDVLTHMATCTRCREVVFLAQKAAESDQPSSTFVSVPQEERTSWFSNRRWAWIPAAAIAGVVGVAVVQHFRRPATETQMSAELSQTTGFQNAESAKIAPPQPTSAATKSKQTQSTQLSDLRDSSLAGLNRDAVRQLDKKRAVEPKELPLATLAPPVTPVPGVAGGSFHGTIAARAKASSVGGPIAASQFQQQDMAQQQSALQLTQTAQANTANKHFKASDTIGAASESVMVQPQPATMAAAPALQASPSTAPATIDSFESSSANLPRLNKVAKISLPNGAGVLSEASAPARVIALDTAGQLFLSEDGGKRWQLIPTQWTGRAVLVRTQPLITQPSALAGVQTMRFELVNEKLQTWVSLDGKTWAPESLPLH